MDYVVMYQRATAVRDAILERISALATQAGIGGSYPCLMAHNAMVGLEYGSPWRGVDYSIVRRIQWLEQKSLEPHRIVSRWAARTVR